MSIGSDGVSRSALLAVRMLAVSDDALLEKLKAFSAEQKEQVIAKDARLAEVGYQNY